MTKSLSIAATGMLAQQLNVEVISNNIANLNTTGFKRQRAEFQDLLYENQLRVGSTSSDQGTIVPAGIQLGSGVNAGAVYRIMEQGSVIQTENDFDVAIRGKGFFRIERPNGEDGFTRAGAFQLSPDGQIVTQDGFTVSPGIVVPADAISVVINDSGEVLAKIDGQIDFQNVGQLELVTFPNEAGLEAIGDNLLLETPASGNPTVGIPGTAGVGSILQGFLETANVNAVTEIVTMITAQRAYEMNSRVITASDEMLRTMTNLR